MCLLADEKMFVSFEVVRKMVVQTKVGFVSKQGTDKLALEFFAVGQFAIKKERNLT